MGYSVILDIIGSFVVGGLLLMILLRMNSQSVQNSYDYTGELVVQKNIVEIVNLLEYDLRKIGYCNDYEKIPDPAKAILKADSSRIWFLTDIVSSSNPYGDSIVDTIKYFLGPASELSDTPNPNDKFLYRVVNNNAPKGANLGLTQFKLTYFDALGKKITSMPASPPLGIAAIQIDVGVENPAAYGQNYSFEKRALWRQVRMASRNFILR